MWFPKCGSQFITITQELIINADSQVLPQDYWISLLGVSWGPDTSGLTSSVGDSDTHWHLRTTGLEDIVTKLMVKCFKKYLYIASQQFAFELMLLKWYLIPVLFVYFSTVLCSDLELTVKAKFALSNPVSSNRHRFSISKVLVTRSYLTLCNPMDCSPPGFSVHGILQERIPFSRGSSRLRDRTQVSCITGRFFTIWVMTRIKECVLCLWTFHTRLCWAPGGGGHQGKETDGALAPQFHLKWLNSHLFYIVDPCFSEMSLDR